MQGDSPVVAKYVAGGGLDNCIRVWDAVTGDLVELFKGHKDSVYSVAFAPNNKHLVSMWELAPREGEHTNSTSGSGRCIKTFEGHKDFALSATFTPDEKWILSASKDNGIKLWDVETGKSQLILQGRKNSVMSVAASPRGGCFASASGDKSMKIWSYKMM